MLCYEQETKGEIEQMRFRLFRRNSKLRGIAHYIASLLLVVFAALIAWNLPEETSPSSIGIILLMSVLGSAAIWGLRPGLTAALCAALIHDYFFVPPIYSFNIGDWRNGFSWIIFGFASIAACIIAESVRRQTRLARRRELLAKRLYALSQRLAKARDVPAIAKVTVSAIGAALGAETVLLIPEGSSVGLAAAHPHDGPPLSDEVKAAIASSKNDPGKVSGIAAGHGLTCRLLPLDTASKKAGVIIVGPEKRRRLGLNDRARIVEQFAGQAAAAVERVALSREVEAAWIAAETEKLRSTMLTSMSHDLKAPLSLILATISSLRDLGPDLSQKQAQDLLDAIEEDGARLHEFIANIIDMSRVESESVRPKCQAADLDDIIGSTLRRAGRLLARHKVVLHLPDDLPPLEVDPALTERVLFNVLDNAAKYAPPDSRVTLEAVQDGAFVDLEVVDEGKGIPEEHLPYLFDKFYRVDTPDSGPDGTGLGLTICRSFLRLMGGSISASNRQDREGAAFTMRFPIHRSMDQANTA